MEATTKDLRLHTRALIAATDRGEEVIITWRGKPRARLVPLDDDEAGPIAVMREPDAPAYAARNPAFGIWSDDRPDNDLDPGELVRRWRRPRDLP